MTDEKERAAERVRYEAARARMAEHSADQGYARGPTPALADVAGLVLPGPRLNARAIPESW